MQVPTVIEINTFTLLHWLWKLKEETDRVVVHFVDWDKDLEVIIDVTCYSEKDDDGAYNHYESFEIDVNTDGYGVIHDDKIYSKQSLLDVKKMIVKAISDDIEDYEYTIDIWENSDSQ